MQEVEPNKGVCPGVFFDATICSGKRDPTTLSLRDRVASLTCLMRLTSGVRCGFRSCTRYSVPLRASKATCMTALGYHCRSYATILLPGFLVEDCKCGTLIISLPRMLRHLFISLPRCVVLPHLGKAEADKVAQVPVSILRVVSVTQFIAEVGDCYRK